LITAYEISSPRVLYTEFLLFLNSFQLLFEICSQLNLFMASSFDRWEKDPFFNAAEEVQESADRFTHLLEFSSIFVPICDLCCAEEEVYYFRDGSRTLLNLSLFLLY